MSEADLKQLLSLQEKDIVIDQLVHRREHLAGHGTVSSLLEDAGRLKLELDVAVKDRDSTASAQNKIEGEVDTIDKRVVEIKGRLYGSSTPSPKDAQAMTQEIEHLQARKAELEDDELVLMEKLDPQGEAVVALEERARDLAEKLETAQSDLRKEQAVIDEQLTSERNERASVAEAVDASLMKTYDGLRQKLGGIAVARLDGDRCGGCHLSLPASERDRIRNAAPGDIVRCEECTRIIVRP